MPWSTTSMEKQRENFVIDAKLRNNFSEVCREYGISRRTGYKWLMRDAADESMKDRSRSPHTTAMKTTSEVEERIVNVRLQHPAWGARKLKVILEREGLAAPSAKTINNILHRHNLILPEESMKRQAYKRFERKQCNEMWQVDFKGEFKMLNNRYCYPLDIIDDHSRYALSIHPVENTANVTIPIFEKAFYEYGMPQSVLSDNGTQFAGFRGGLTRFEVWLIDHDVKPIHGRVCHPQTQGKIERLHRAMKAEIALTSISNISDATKILNDWRIMYNTVRPHEALQMRTPSEVYKPSERVYSPKVTEYEYGGDYNVIKVNGWGYVRFKGLHTYISESLRKKYLEFRPTPHGESYNVCYRNYIIAEVSAIDGNLINRKIKRI